MSEPHRACPACGEDRPRVLYRPRLSPGPVVRCGACRMAYVSPVEDPQAIIEEGPILAGLDPAVLTSADMRDVAGSWELTILAGKEPQKTALERNASGALRELARFARPPGSLLDIGCGWGFFLGVAARLGWTTHGLEPLPAHAVHTRATTGSRVVCDVLRDGTFAEESFDVVTSFQVFEHLPDPSAYLERVRRLLRSSGLVLIEVPNFDTWSVRVMGSRARHFSPDHLNFFSARTLGRLLESHGFEPLHTYYPTRFMTLGHLVGHWGRRYLRGPLTAAASGSRGQSGVWTKTVGVNLRDIVAVIARRTAP